MRSDAEYERAYDLWKHGLNDCEIGALLSIPRTTVRAWRHGIRGVRQRQSPADACPRCGGRRHVFPHPEYSYLLGMYLGDGHISRMGRTYRLRVTFDRAWPGLFHESLRAMQAVFPENKISVCHDDPNSHCLVSSLYSNQLPCLFPQHGPGLKHLRRIALADWQQGIVEAHSDKFVRGLIHSDGSRFMNRVTIKGKEYAYPRYNFTNASGDISGLFTDALDRLGIAWRQMNARNISVARREAVARLDEFVGPKY
jgi:hypothetical protein